MKHISDLISGTIMVLCHHSENIYIVTGKEGFQSMFGDPNPMLWSTFPGPHIQNALIMRRPSLGLNIIYVIFTASSVPIKVYYFKGTDSHRRERCVLFWYNGIGGLSGARCGAKKWWGNKVGDRDSRMGDPSGLLASIR